jgi:AraC-like DNA-binding protein
VRHVRSSIIRRGGTSTQRRLFAVFGGLYTAGRHRVRRKQGGRLVEGWSDPGTVNLSPTNFYARWEADGSSHSIVVFVRDALLSRVILEKNYIEENLGKPIALQELAGLACVSVRHFERASRQSLGVPPHRYVLERRLSAARNLLLSHPNLNIEEIARQLGFSSSSHFSSTFVRRMGCSPATFRRAHV